MGIAILMATYNGEKYIKEQINSIINQSFKNWTLYIRDDGSKDGTPDIIKGYSEKYPEKIILIPKNKGKNGSKYNFFELCKAIKNTEHKYFMFCDQDDVWNSDKIEKTFDCMKKAETESSDIPLLVHTDLQVVDKNLNIINNSFVKYSSLKPKFKTVEKLLIQNNVTGCTMMINKALLEKALMAENTDKMVMHDWWFALVASVYGKIVFLDVPTIRYRQHEKNVVGASLEVNTFKFVTDRLSKRDYIKNTFKKSREQSKLFLDTYKDFDVKKQSVMYKFSEMEKYNKIKRIYTVIRYGFFKQGFVQVVGELLFI